MLIDSGQAFRRSAMPHSISVSKQTVIPLAIGIEKSTGGVVSVREWPGLSAGLRS